MTSEEYRDAAMRYLRHAREALGEGDHPQASEKLWGAAAEMVKAIAEARGWRHDGHAQLFRVINQLTEETGDRELAGLFRGACALHTNFYEQWLPSEDVERAAEDINQLVQKLDGLLGVAA